MNVNNDESIILQQLCKFYENSREWILEYKDYAKKFSTEMVERKLSIIDLNDSLSDCTVLILTANSVEQNILTRKLYQEVNANKATANEEKLVEIYADGCIYQFAYIQNIKIVHMHPNSTSSFTLGGSANAVRSALERFRPKLVVSLGVAFGIEPEKQQLGDVILSGNVIPYDVFNKDTDGVIRLRNDDKFFTHEALNAWNVLTRNSNFSLEEKIKRCSLINRELNFKWQYGTVLSGGSVLSNENKKQALLRATIMNGEDKVIGGEMEGTGVYFECKKPDIPCIVIKGICDWGAEKNSWKTAINIVEESKRRASKEELKTITNDLVKDCVQAYAMDNATEAFFRLLRFDSSFLDNYSKTSESGMPSIPNGRKIFWHIKQFFKAQKRKILQIVSIYLLLFVYYAIINFSIKELDYPNEEELFTLIYKMEFLFSICVTGLLIIRTSMEIHPISVHHPWVNFCFIYDLEEGDTRFFLNDSRPIFRVVISQWMIEGKVNLGFEEIGDIKEKHSWISHVKLNEKGKILQISYELANGNHYVHLISRKRLRRFFLRKTKMYVYHERIFLMDGQKDILVGERNVVEKRNTLVYDL